METNETARERVERLIGHIETHGKQLVSRSVARDLRELLRIPTCNSEIIDELLSLKPFLESHHCKTTVIDKAVELLRITEAGGGIYHRMRWYADHADKRPLNIELLKADCAEAAARLEARPTVIEGDALREALIDWQNAWLCPETNFAQQVPRLLRQTDAALAVSLEQLKEK